ncbi:MAG: hypothetical protein J0G94_00195 [Sphingomonadales bacterium]|nr:hypothetical protein [Sphingomonadales bacterium]
MEKSVGQGIEARIQIARGRGSRKDKGELCKMPQNRALGASALIATRLDVLIASGSFSMGLPPVINGSMTLHSPYTVPRHERRPSPCPPVAVVSIVADRRRFSCPKPQKDK